MGRKRKNGRATSIAWGVACLFRQRVDSFYGMNWPEDGLTKKEQDKVARALGYISAAQDEIRSVQGSLSDRSKLAGYDRPDYEMARRMNP